MSDRKKGSSKMERNVSPDSTTKFFEGEEVFVQNNDQFILGKIREINVAAEKCLVNIDSGESLWVVFKDLKPWTIDIDEDSIICNMCKNTQSKKNNSIITCEVCFRGYHQKCHQPPIESTDANWICKKCLEKRNCHFIENSETQKTATSTSKDLTLPENLEEIFNNGKKKRIRNSVHMQPNMNTFKGQKVCIKSASPPFYVDEQQKTTSKVKKKKSSIEMKMTINSSTFNNLLPEFPPTPPSSISAPETPQTLSMNGEAPLSPNDEVTYSELRDSNSIDVTTCRLEELFNIFEEPPPSDVTFPVQLNPVIMHPLMRTTKRHLSEKDIDIVSGVITYKKRRRFRRQSSINVRQQNGFQMPNSPLKIVHRTSKVDLKTQVYSYYGENNKIGNGEGKLNKFGSGSEYRICGKRTTLNGQIQYLVERVQCFDPL